MIKLHTLGSLDLRGADGHELRSILAQPKRLALLAYLAVCSTRGFVRRDQVLALFWPEQDREHARAALNRALYYLRQSLGENVLISRGDEEIGLAGEKFFCDAAAFQSAVAEGRDLAAVELYRGDLLEGFFVSDALGFERWLETEREQLRQLAVRSAWQLADAQHAAGNILLAAHHARWAVEHAPYDEAGVQRLVTLLYKTGDRAGAVHEYEQFARRIGRELELSPSSETRAVVDAIRVNDHPTEISRAVPESPAPRFEPVAEDAIADAVVETPPARKATRPKLVLAGIAALLAIATIPAIRWVLPTELAEKDVLVMPFQNRTGDPSLDPVARLATDWIRRDIEDAAPRSSSDAALIAARAATRVTGAIDRVGTQLRVSAQIHTPQGLIWAIGPFPAHIDSPAPAIGEVRQRVNGGIASLRNGDLASWFPLATAPPTLEAYAEFSEGMRLSRNDHRDALTHFAHAAALDSTFTLALLHTIPLHRMLLHPDSAKAVIARLNSQRLRLRPLQLHWLDWLAYMYQDATKAYEALRSAAELAPERFRGPFAWAALTAHRPREALAIAQRQERDHPSSMVSVRADAHHELGEYDHELEVLMRARAGRAVELNGLWREVRARAALGQVRNVMALLDTALASPPVSGTTPGAVMGGAALEFRAHGHHAAAQQALDRAIAWYRARPGHEAVDERNRWGLAYDVYLAGCLSPNKNERLERLAEAEALFRSLVVAHPNYNDDVQGLLGAIEVRRGERQSAHRILASLEDRTKSSAQAPGEVFFAIATIRAMLGDAEGTIRALRDWSGGQGFDLHTEVHFESLKINPEFREFVRPKG